MKETKRTRKKEKEEVNIFFKRKTKKNRRKMLWANEGAKTKIM